jgi:hypothetical protein
MESQSSETKRSPDPIARILAVFALVVGAIVIAIVIAGSTGGSDTSEQTRDGSGPGRAQRHSYCVVHSGDTFAAIAVEAGVPEMRLAQLNPNLDQFSIQPQNCVNLVPKGCKELAGEGQPTPCT